MKNLPQVTTAKAALSLFFAFICINTGFAQSDTLHLNYNGMQTAPHDTTVAKIDKWVKSLNGQHVDISIVAYYSMSKFKEAAVSRTDELFLILNRKARSLITIESQEPKKGANSQRSRVDIVYKFSDPSKAPKKETPVAVKNADEETRKDKNKEEVTTNNDQQAAPAQARESSSEGSSESNLRHVIKLNVPQLFLVNISMQYELAFHKKMSVALGGHYVVPRKVSTIINSFSKEDTQGKDIGFVDPVISGWAITPEFRFYPFADEDKRAPAGFYIAAYYRQSQYSMVSIYNEFYDGVTYNLNFTSKYSMMQGGVMIGAQWLLGKSKRVSIDWWIVGLGGGLIAPRMEASSSNINLNTDEQADMKAGVQEYLVGFPLLPFNNPKVTTDSKGFVVTMDKVPFFTARGLGLCIGYSF